MLMYNNKSTPEVKQLSARINMLRIILDVREKIIIIYFQISFAGNTDQTSKEG